MDKKEKRKKRLFVKRLEDERNVEIKVYSNGNLISVLCGTVGFEELQRSVNPSLSSAPGGCLNVSFYSDFSNNQRHSGFRGFYTIQDYDECEDPDNRCSQFCHNFIGGYYCSCRHGYNLDGDNHTCAVSCSEDLSGQTQGRVSSPSWPGLYPENSHCVSTLSVEPHLQLQLSFHQPFDLEQDAEGACLDSLRIETHYGTLGPFCGRSAPPSPLQTYSHQLKIHFETDGYGTNQGFSLSFTTAAADRSQKQKNSKRIRDDVSELRKLESSLHLPTGDILVVVGSDRPQTLYQSQVKFNCSSPFYELQGDVCGRPQSSPRSTARILGGESAKLGHIPWYLLIKEPRRGGASLISDRWAVTAAHVVDGFEEANLLWYGGMVDGKSPVFVELRSQKVILHPGYVKGIASNSRTNFDNDIALIRFTSRVELGAHISPICLPEKNTTLMENDVGTIAGFGVREASGRGLVAQKLKHAPILVISEATCRNTPNNGAIRYTDNMFCAGADGRDSCEKDSGGPFFVPKLGANERPHRLLGIVSWGPACHMTEFRGYYTKVKNYVPWILETIEATEKSLKEADEE
ncbi:hypothetical protein NQD34_011576 [Periophthalmus magnuspinnatus]|nr:hypothetical protein NQD34_011576 [Periophthalmus magnuspinnatus]